MTGIEYSHGGYGKVYAINLFDGDTKIAVKSFILMVTMRICSKQKLLT